jgi:hypothetical protein
MDKVIVTGNDFLKLTFDTPITDKDYDKVVDVINDFMEGKTLISAIEAHGLTYRKFRYLLANNPTLSINFDDIADIHKDTTKHMLIDKLMQHVEANDLSALKFALERMYPDDFGKKVDVTNHNVTEDNPKILERFVKAEYE